MTSQAFVSAQKKFEQFTLAQPGEIGPLLINLAVTLVECVAAGRDAGLSGAQLAAVLDYAADVADETDRITRRESTVPSSEEFEAAMGGAFGVAGFELAPEQQKLVDTFPGNAAQKAHLLSVIQEEKAKLDRFMTSLPDDRQRAAAGVVGSAMEQGILGAMLIGGDDSTIVGVINLLLARVLADEALSKLNASLGDASRLVANFELRDNKLYPESKEEAFTFVKHTFDDIRQLRDSLPEDQQQDAVLLGARISDDILEATDQGATRETVIATLETLLKGQRWMLQLGRKVA